MAVTWKSLLQRRGNTSLREYAEGRGITTYEQLCDSFSSHGLAPPTREDAANFLQEAPETSSSTPSESSSEVVSSEEPAAEVLYESEGDARRRRRKENFEKANKPKGK